MFDRVHIAAIMFVCYCLVETTCFLHFIVLYSYVPVYERVSYLILMILCYLQ